MLVSSECITSSFETTIIGAAHSQKHSIFGPAGFQKYREKNPKLEFNPIYGNYIHIQKTREGLDISTDPFGMSKIFIYRYKENWAISDSLCSLAELVRSKGWHLTPYVPAIHALLARMPEGYQMSSYRTPISEIQLLPYWFSVHIHGDRMVTKVLKDNEEAKPLPEAIKETGRFFSSLYQAYKDHGFKPYLTLSGGLDCRATLAALTSNLRPEERGAVDVFTADIQGKSNERPIVESLCSKFKLNLLHTRPAARWPTWDEWKYAFLGTQSHFAPYPRMVLDTPIFTGACAGVLKEFYDWGGKVSSFSCHPKTTEDIANSIREDVFNAVDWGLYGLLSDLPVEIRHYTLFRNRFHFGREPFDTVFSYPPLVYSLWKSFEGAETARNIHRVIFELGGRELVEHLYDVPEKSFSGMAGSDWREFVVSGEEPDQRELHYDLDTSLDYHSSVALAPQDWSGEKHHKALYQGLLEHGTEAAAFARRSGALDEWIVEQAEFELGNLRSKGFSDPHNLRAILAVLAFRISFD